MELMTTTEVADYLRLGERKIYDLVREQVIPCIRITGKLLFPRQAVDLWLMNHLEGASYCGREIPPILAGSHDPLLEWAARESGSGLALLLQGSGDGIKRLLADEVQAIGFHLVHDDGSYNDPERSGLGGLCDLVTIVWAQRQQGLMMAPGNPHGITGVRDLTQPKLRVVRRPEGTGADVLLLQLLQRASLRLEQLHCIAHRAITHDDLALTISADAADCGLGVEAAARRHGLDFLPIARERFDLAMHRRSYFQPQLQTLFQFARTEPFRAQARALGGYDLSRLGEVHYNA